MQSYRNYYQVQRIMEKHEDGWDQLSENSEEVSHLVSLYKQNEARNILNQQYSLEPDMITGWMPKLPSCPIPLTYQNKYTQEICERLMKEPLYQIVYRGDRCINSVQLHKRYNYKWKYRERYDVKINLIAEAINTIGLEQEVNKLDKHNYSEKMRESQIQFDSNFESGNLDLAIRVKKNQYDCFIRSDTNTKGHTNWYFFKVSNKKYLGTVQLNICNIVKKRNLYGKGMTPYSKVIEKGTKSNEWTQNQCYDIQFVQRLCRYGTGKTSYQLQFKYDFTRQNTEVYLAYSIPYTYSNLLDFIEEIRPHPFVRISSTCQSFSGLDLPLITISNESQHKKSCVIVTARIHPGETNSSFLLQGFIRALLQNSVMSNKLVSGCNFYIVPMMNPDGVVVGNYRTSFSGRDLNRKFDEIGNFLYPEINGLVDLVKKLKKQRQKIDFFFDFHSHSSKKNLFCYGPQHQEGTPSYFRSKVFIKILDKQDSMFDYDKCIQSISQYKKSTARAYMLRKQFIPMTFTFQISNGLYSLTKDIQSTYDVESLLRAGKIIFQGLSEYAVIYLRDFDHIHNKPNPRFSLNLAKKSPLLKKLPIRRTQNLSASFEYLANNNHDIKELLQEITLQNQVKQEFQQKFSDNQQSDNDIQESQLKELFDLRKKYESDLEVIFDSGQKNRNLLRKNSLKNLSRQSSAKRPMIKTNSQKILGKVNLNIQKKLQADINIPVTCTSKVGKYKKNRIYYEQTHPPNVKKHFQRTNSMKKAIKQKRFPIIF